LVAQYIFNNIGKNAYYFFFKISRDYVILFMEEIKHSIFSILASEEQQNQNTCLATKWLSRLIDEKRAYT